MFLFCTKTVQFIKLLIVLCDVIPKTLPVDVSFKSCKQTFNQILLSSWNPLVCQLLRQISAPSGLLDPFYKAFQTVLSLLRGRDSSSRIPGKLEIGAHTPKNTHRS